VNFALYCCCDLDFDRMTFIYEVDPYALKMYPKSKNELSTSKLSKVIALHTCRQMAATENITTPCQYKNYNLSTVFWTF